LLALPLKAADRSSPEGPENDRVSGSTLAPPPSECRRVGARTACATWGRPPPAIELDGDQLGELGRDICHWLFCSAQAASRAEQGADFAESFVRRVVHDGNKQVTR
jgi:hypothetical protein